MRDLSNVIRSVQKFVFKNSQSKVYTNQSTGKATKLDFSWRSSYLRPLSLIGSSSHIFADTGPIKSLERYLFPIWDLF